MTQITPDIFTTPPSSIMLGADEVHIWRVFLHRFPADDAILSEDEQVRAARFKFSPPRERFIKTRLALRQILSLYTKRPPAALKFTYNVDGKPQLDDLSLQFNLSHADNCALIAVTKARFIGIDLETVRELSISARAEIQNTAFTAHEISEIRKFSQERQTLAFFRCWTRKEAVVKAHGTGFRTIQGFSVSVDVVPLVLTESGYSLYEVIPEENQIGALVLPAYEWRIKAYNFIRD